MVVSRAVVTRTSRSILHRTSVGCQESKTKLWTAKMEKIKVISSVQDSLTLQKELFCQIEMAAYDALPWWTNWQMLHRTICLLYVLNIVNLAWIYCLKDANKDTKLACTKKNWLKWIDQKYWNKHNSNSKHTLSRPWVCYPAFGTTVRCYLVSVKKKINLE